MSVPTLPIDPQWIAHTLTPYLHYAFQHVFHRNLDITPYIQRALDFSRSKPDSSTDGDDLIFERVFFAIERQHQGLPAELIGLTENLEPLALFLIRRAQIKGPYELLGRGVQPSDAWKRYESERLMRIAAENVKAMQNQKQPTVPTYCVSAAVDPPAPSAFKVPTGPPPMNYPIDPRLLYASPGHFTAPGLSETLTLSELQYYHHRNREIEASVAMRLARLPNQQQGYGMQHLVPGSPVTPQGYQQNNMLPVGQRHHNGATSLVHVPNPTFRQQYTPSYVQYPGQRQSAMPTQYPSQAPVSTAQTYVLTQPAQHLLQHSGYLQPPGYPSRPPMQNMQQRLVPVASRPIPAQPVSLSTWHDNTHPGLPTLTKPAGISNPTSKTPTTAILPDFSDPAQRATSMSAFKKLSREEKIAKILELERAEKAMNPNMITPLQKFFIRAAADQAAATKAAAAGEDTTKQSKNNAVNMAEPSDQQAIMVPAPAYQTHQGADMTTQGVGGFASYPEYSNITSSVPSPQSHGSLSAPTLAPKREEM